MGRKTLCTDKGYWKDLPNKETKKVLSKLAAGRFTKHAVAQFVTLGEHCASLDDAIIFSFRINPKSLTKQEKKAVKFAFKVSQAAFMHSLHKMLLINEKAHATLKTVAEIRGLIKQQTNDNDDKGFKPGLNVHVHNESKDNIEAPKIEKPVKREPLRLVVNN